MHRRLARPLASLAVLALAVTGCSTGSSSDDPSDGTSATSSDGSTATSDGSLGAEDAASVNGVTISNAVFDEYASAAQDTLGDDPDDQELLALRRTTLARLIETEILTQFAEANGATLDDAAVEQIVADGGEELVTAASTTGLTPNQYARVFAAPDYLLDQVTRAVASGIEVTDEQVEERLAGGIEGVTATLSHLLVETEDAAVAALERVEGGEDFADVAADVSIDGSAAQGGRLDQGEPVPLSNFVPEFAQAAAEAPLDEVVGPVQSEFGFHLILVDSRNEPDAEAMAEDLRLQMALESEEGQAAMAPLVEEFQTLFTDADVQVASRYGVWDAANRDVVAEGDLVGEGEAPIPGVDTSEAPAPVPTATPS